MDVIVPVYGAAPELSRCLRSIGETTDLELHHLVLVIDGPQVNAVEEQVAMADELRAKILRNDKRAGFVVSVNRGMSVSERDVVLLNSDTEVTRGWLERLQEAVYSAARIATATPFSNNATICSLPRFLEDNELPNGFQREEFARLIAERSKKEYPRLPTGVGVCLYIRRETIEEVGLFDEESFRLGYGEETDFCMRARKVGWEHVLADDAFVYHAGHRSFGPEHKRRIRQAHRVMRRRHPGYRKEIADFIRRDPLQTVRERVIAALRRPRSANAGAEPERVLHLVHGWPPYNFAGTELYARWLVREQSQMRHVVVYSRLGDRGRITGQAVEYMDQGVRVRLMVNNFDQRSPLRRNAIVDRRLAADFGQILEEEDVQLVHVHHLAGHAANLTREATRRDIPVVYQLQDWWGPCARVNLFHRNGRLCGGPGRLKCGHCFALTARPPRRILNPLLYEMRWRALRAGLRSAAVIVAGSEFIVESHRALGWLPESVPVRVIPYGIERSGLACRRREPRLPLRFGVIGSLMPHKGVHVAVDAFAGIDPGRAVLEVWGDPAVAPDYSDGLVATSPEGVRWHGRFPEQDRAAIFDRLDVLVVPSLGLESFGLVAREAMACGVPLLLSNRGALAELAESSSSLVGATFSPGNSVGLRDLVLSLISNPRQISEWSEGLPKVKGMREHAAEMELVYQQLLEDSPKP